VVFISSAHHRGA